MSIEWGLTFLDSDPGSNHGSLDNAAGAVDSQMSNHLSLSMDDSQSGEAVQGAPGGGRWRKPVAGRMVGIP